MVKIIYVEFGGIEYVVEVVNGLIVMEGVCDNNISGIEVDCGGVCVCLICYVYVDEVWVDKLLLMDDMEEDMLDFVFELKSGLLWLIC